MGPDVDLKDVERKFMSSLGNEANLDDEAEVLKISVDLLKRSSSVKHDDKFFE